VTTKKQDIALVGVGAAACAVCCAGPILGVLAAIGLGTALGVALFGSIALVLGLLAAIIVVRRRRARSTRQVSVDQPVEVFRRA
jgi:uncharacterized protein (DUF58 family)